MSACFRPFSNILVGGRSSAVGQERKGRLAKCDRNKLTLNSRTWPMADSDPERPFQRPTASIGTAAANMVRATGAARTTAASRRNQGCAANRTPPGPISPG